MASPGPGPTAPIQLGLLRARLQASGTRIIDVRELEGHEKLGEGTNGTVYRMVWHRPVENDAIVVAAKKTNGGSQNEIEVLMQLRHPYIIGYYGVVIEEPTFMIVMEYAPNGSLDEYLANSQITLPLDRILRWCVNLAVAVQYLHDSNFVHRDIKASNCLISDGLDLKLCDFHDACELEMTITTTERGSWPWMAPEVMSDRTFSKKSDIYSLAVVFWQILTCQVPFAGVPNSMQVVWRVCEKGERPEIPQDCPDSFASLLRDCWKPDRNDRPDIAQVLAILSQIENDTVHAQ